MLVSQKYNFELYVPSFILFLRTFVAGRNRSCCSCHQFTFLRRRFVFISPWVLQKGGVLMLCLSYLQFLRNADVEHDFNIICCSWFVTCNSRAMCGTSGSGTADHSLVSEFPLGVFVWLVFLNIQIFVWCFVDLCSSLCLF